MTESPSLPESRRALVLVWLVLVVSTIAAWWFAPGHTTELVAVVVVLAFVKCRLVLRWFMEVRAAPRWLRLGTDAWLVLLWAGLAGIYFSG
ncbi:cytochrome C oxidase subunit IV family protein [Nocardia asteroides]|uniref:cytochrome C oxidase subunit IV family protein n=1 Tax=Nocardia asteroides TaxID=1824 RepID=UPI001E286FF6|nr:cytochrome C oxidase subunit IV family protein [Nocardia asteroides]UGT61896.1 cytochrome C oxidase subunit IV family protein [Nocardia asteroides]